MNRKEIKNTTTDIANILNKTSGIRIRASGGLGSNYTLSLNGLTGNQVRIFVDEIPIDELGDAYNLNNIFVNLIERIDIYKGVVPVKLGTDAGGAIHIITDTKETSFVDTSYSLGSLNTHRLNINTQYRAKKSGFTFKLTGVSNYSDNDYTIYEMPFFVNAKETLIDTKRCLRHLQIFIGRCRNWFYKYKLGK
jgi:outer membrane cobalamin receptor